MGYIDGKVIAFENVVSTASKYYVDDVEPALSNAAVWAHFSKKRSVFGVYVWA